MWGAHSMLRELFALPPDGHITRVHEIFTESMAKRGYEVQGWRVGSRRRSLVFPRYRPSSMPPVSWSPFEPCRAGVCVLRRKNKKRSDYKALQHEVFTLSRANAIKTTNL